MSNRTPVITTDLVMRRQNTMNNISINCTFLFESQRM